MQKKAMLSQTSASVVRIKAGVRPSSGRRLLDRSIVVLKARRTGDLPVLECTVANTEHLRWDELFLPKGVRNQMAVGVKRFSNWCTVGQPV